MTKPKPYRLVEPEPTEFRQHWLCLMCHYKHYHPSVDLTNPPCNCDPKDAQWVAVTLPEDAPAELGVVGGARTVIAAVVLAVAALVIGTIIAIAARGDEVPQCVAPCVDPTTVSCGVPIPTSCADFEESMTRIFINSEAPAMPPGLLARVRATVNWKKGSKIDSARQKLLTDVREWVEVYVLFKNFQPTTSSTGKTVSRVTSDPEAVNRAEAVSRYIALGEPFFGPPEPEPALPAF